MKKLLFAAWAMAPLFLTIAQTVMAQITVTTSPLGPIRPDEPVVTGVAWTGEGVVTTNDFTQADKAKLALIPAGGDTLASVAARGDEAASIKLPRERGGVEAYEPAATVGDLAAYARTVNGAAPDAGGDVTLAIPPAPDLSAYVKKVNNTAPDAGGNVALAIPPAPTDATLQVNLAPLSSTGIQIPYSGPLRDAMQSCANSLNYISLNSTPPLKTINVQGDGNYDLAPAWDGVGQYVFFFPDESATYELDLAAFNAIPNNIEVLLVFAMNTTVNDNSCDVSIANWLGARSNVVFQDSGWFDTFTVPQDGRTPVVLAVRRCILGYMRDALLLRKYQ